MDLELFSIYLVLQLKVKGVRTSVVKKFDMMIF